MRVFVALPVPEHIQDHTVAALRGVRDDDRVTWTRPDGWHLTLAFVGDVDHVAPVVAAVRDAVDAAAVRPVDLATGSAVVLGRRALGLAIIEPDGAPMMRLGETIQQGLEDADLPVTRRRVRLHLTLARARRRSSIPADMVEPIDVAPARWLADTVAVYRSVLGTGPATYEVMASVPLG